MNSPTIVNSVFGDYILSNAMIFTQDSRYNYLGCIKFQWNQFIFLIYFFHIFFQSKIGTLINTGKNLSTVLRIHTRREYLAFSAHTTCIQLSQHRVLVLFIKIRATLFLLQRDDNLSPTLRLLLNRVCICNALETTLFHYAHLVRSQFPAL